MLSLTKKSKAIIKKRTGLDVKKLSNTDFCILDKNLEKKTHHELQHMSGDDDQLLGRGSVYVYLNRLLDIKKTNKEISRI